MATTGVYIHENTKSDTFEIIAFSFLSHLLIAGCDIGVQISVSPSVRPSGRPSVHQQLRRS